MVERIHGDLTNFQGTGMGVMEISHRAPEIEFLIADAAERTRGLLGVGRDWDVLFVQGGGSVQFCMVPLNFSAPGDPVDYLDTGYWARKSIAEARTLGRDVAVVVRKSMLERSAGHGGPPGHPERAGRPGRPARSAILDYRTHAEHRSNYHTPPARRNHGGSSMAEATELSGAGHALAH